MIFSYTKKNMLYLDSSYITQALASSLLPTDLTTESGFCTLSKFIIIAS